jgi:GTP-binding protein
VANYAFTTLQPNLGVVQVGEFPHTQSFSVADLPGLIEGAHQGAGLGIQFLKHIERTSVIVHLVDVSESSAAAGGNDRPDPVADFKVITAELATFDPALAAEPTILVAAKIDVANPSKLKKLAAFAKRRQLPFYAISSVTGEGIEPLKYAIAEMVEAHRPAPFGLGEPNSPTPVSGKPAKRRPAYPPPAPRARGRAR